MARTREEVENLIITQLIEISPYDGVEIKPHTVLTDELGIDSLDRVELAIILERELSICIDDVTFEEKVTVEEVIDYVYKLARE